jgi:plastocyanin
VRGALISAVAIACFGAAASPAAAADVTISNFSFSPPTVSIALGETVTWHWAGPDTNHSVTSDPNQPDSWDSDPMRAPLSTDHPPGDTFDHRFDSAGTFTYFCKVHPSMQGTVKVAGAGGESPPPPADTTAPTVSGLKAAGGRRCRPRTKKCKGKATVVRFSLSEEAQVKIAAGGKTRATLAGQPGANTAKLSTKKLPPGKYTLSVSATDSAGNASQAAKATVRVKRR